MCIFIFSYFDVYLQPELTRIVLHFPKIIRTALAVLGLKKKCKDCPGETWQKIAQQI